MPDAPARTRLLLVDDHALFREGLARLLAVEEDFEVAGHCATVSEGLGVLAAQRIDVVLLDVDLGGDRGSDFLAQARSRGFDGPVLLVTAGMSDAEAALLMAQGAAGIFLKQDSAELLAEGIRTVSQGRTWLDQRHLASLLARQQSQAEAPRGLTAREREVLRGVLDGLANKEIAARVAASESAVKAVLQQLFRKTGVRTRGQLVRVALERYSGEL